MLGSPQAAVWERLSVGRRAARQLGAKPMAPGVGLAPPDEAPCAGHHGNMPEEREGWMDAAPWTEHRYSPGGDLPLRLPPSIGHSGCACCPLDLPALAVFLFVPLSWFQFSLWRLLGCTHCCFQAEKEAHGQCAFLETATPPPVLGTAVGACIKLLGTNTAALQRGDKEVAKSMILHCLCTVCTGLYKEKKSQVLFSQGQVFKCCVTGICSVYYP